MKLCPSCGREWPDETRFCPHDGSTLRAGVGGHLIGSVIADRYHITQKLGEGGMGAVYLGEHVKMGRKSAIKVMTRSIARDPDALARFHREAANAARINHPNVCAVYDFGETQDGTVYLAMEFIDGETLSALLEREGVLSMQRAARILRQTGDALQAAHDLGIVHRDLKPDNIMITKDRDGDDVVKVVDFGIAKAISGEERQKVTQTGLVVGTPDYMSPEQLAGDALDSRSDIYSLGLVLYRALTGRLPFPATSAQEVMIKRLTDAPISLNEAVPHARFPQRLQAVMDRALARMPAERYAQVAQFAKDVSDAVAGIADGGVGTEAATQIMPGPHAGPAAVATTRISGTAARTHTPDTPAVPTRIAPAARAPKRPVLAIAATVAVVVAGGGTAALMLTRNGRGTGPVGGPSANVGSRDTARTARSDTAGPRSSAKLVSGTPRSSNNEVRTAAQPADAPPPRANTVGGAAPPPAVGGIPISTSDADQRLNALFDLLDSTPTPPWIASAIRDTAMAYYDASGILTKDKAFAAYLVASAERILGHNAAAKRWAQLAVSLAPGTKAYQVLLEAYSRPQ